MARKLAYALLFFCWASHLQAQGFSIPLSDKVMELNLTLPGGQSARATVRDGTMLTIRDEASGYIYGFVAFFDKTSGQPSLLPFGISDLEGGGQSLKQLGKVRDLSMESSVSVQTAHGAFGFSLEKTDTWEFPRIRPLDKQKARPRPSELQGIYGKAGGGNCCVGCGSIIVCGTTVDMDCGSCDSSGGGYRIN